MAGTGKIDLRADDWGAAAAGKSANLRARVQIRPQFETITGARDRPFRPSEESMTSRTLYAALVLPDTARPDPRPVIEAAVRALALHDPRADGAPVRNPRKHSVHGETLGLRVTPQHTAGQAPRLLIELFDRDGAIVAETADAPENRTAVAVLAEVVSAGLRNSEAQAVEWAAPGALIPRAEFMALHGYVSPRRGTPGTTPEARRDAPRGRLGAWFAAQALPRAPGQARYRAAGWALTALLATVSLPVALVVSVVGLVRGMDFRLSAQVLVVTLLVMALLDGWPGLVSASAPPH
jgi:hypothetical protein